MRTKYEDASHSFERQCTCKKCNHSFTYKPDDIVWDENGYGYSTKLVKCTNCNSVNVLNHIEDYGLNTNFDNRFYSYIR